MWRGGWARRSSWRWRPRTWCRWGRGSAGTPSTRRGGSRWSRSWPRWRRPSPPTPPSPGWRSTPTTAIACFRRGATSRRGSGPGRFRRSRRPGRSPRRRSSSTGTFRTGPAPPGPRWLSAPRWPSVPGELWVDADLAGDYNEAVNSSDDFQFGLSPGNFKEIKPEVHLWVPSAAPGSLAGIQIAAQKKPFGYTLELRLPAKAVGHSAFQAGFKMGIMADLSDTDDARQPQKCMLSSSPERQWGDPTTFNVLELQ
ncbi:MAG: hypothetical protein HYZ93_02905 [Candidatus Omnitrophica bacterium]|nr:hypothetical protein [Candidatus Omnitrophota bacterium]